MGVEIIFNTKLVCCKFLSVIILGAYIASYYTIYPVIGNTLLIVSVIPLALVLWAFNIYYAIGAQWLLILHRWLALYLVGIDDGIMLSFQTIIGTSLNFMVLFMMNYLIALNNKLKIVERKLISQNKELVIIKNKAEESDRLKTTFIANISHEIRTPLNSIVGFSTLLMDKDLCEEDKNDFFDKILISSERLTQQIDGVIEMSRLMADQVPLIESVFHLNGLMDKLYMDSSRNLISNTEVKLQMYTEFDNGQDVILTDKLRLSQILKVLVCNAIKFTNKGCIKISYKIRNEIELLFTVEDTGIGIAPKYNDVIFDCFRQGEDESYTRAYEGTGLGLSISKASVEMLGGKIWFTSTSGEGSTFYFTIPYKPISKQKKALSINGLSGLLNTSSQKAKRV